jgi:metal-dependent hydrolase (beta-lactamase superfamily II)
MKTYKIMPLALSILEGDLSVLTYRFNYGQRLKAPIYCFYIEGADKHILVDTGANAEYGTKYRPELPIEDVQSFEDALGSVGVKPSDIDLVIATHLQWDHIANRCTNAKVVVQEEELRFALAPHPILAPTYHKHLFNGLNFVPVRGHHEIAPGIELIPAPGHTPGCQAVSVNTTKGKAIITGFCSTFANFEPPKDASNEIQAITPVISPGIHLNAVEAFESTLYIKGLADILIPVHEPSFMKVKSIP